MNVNVNRNSNPVALANTQNKTANKKLVKGPTRETIPISLLLMCICFFSHLSILFGSTALLAGAANTTLPILIIEDIIPIIKPGSQNLKINTHPNLSAISLDTIVLTHIAIATPII